MKLQPGQTLAQYEIHSALGSGGMGEVYLARDTRLRREVAVKVLSGPQASDPEWRARFLREAQLLASLNHPNIATIHGLEDASDGTRYLILERVEGATLAERLTSGALPVKDALEICGQIATALSAAHAKGVVHRDLKPGNVMLTPQGSVKLLDFGLASSSGVGIGAGSKPHSIQDTKSFRRDTSTVTGTPGYMSPEQVRGEAQDQRTDIFSFGCVLFECLSGRKAFTGKSAPEAMGAVLYAQPDLGALPVGTPSGIQSLLTRCLEKDPAFRLRDIGDARIEIESAKGSRGTRTAPAPVPAAPTHNLPKPRTSFIGREKELAECGRLLDENRVLTLTGVGGSGKTRMALKIAEGRLGTHPDGVWFVDLAPIQDQARVEVAVATALGVKEEPGGSLRESLTAHLATRDALLVLDNCEHVLTASTELAEALLAASPALKILATSREGLGLDGEHLFAVRSLSVPRAGEFRDREAIESSDAIHLFVDRARAADARFALDGRNGPIVAEICRRLDGIPLAIELAAARVKLLSVEQIRSKLDDRFRLLTGNKTALPRHQTLRAAVQWSYDQLAPEEQKLLQDYSVFAGGWTLEGGVAVSGEGADEFEVLDALTRLVDKSLVVVEREGSGEPRYRMLETVRQYAEERLSESGRGDEVRGRHLGYYVDFVERADHHLVDADAGDWLPKLDAELENIHSAIAWCSHAPGGAQLQMRIAGAMRYYWDSRGLFDIGLRIGRAALARSDEQIPHEVRKKVLFGIGLVASRMGMHEETIGYGEMLVTVCTAAGDRTGVGSAHRLLGIGHSLKRNMTAARRHLEEAVATFRELNDPARLASSLGAVGELLRVERDYAAALPLYEESLTLARRGRDEDTLCVMLMNVAATHIELGNPPAARKALREALQIALRLKSKYIGTAGILISGALAVTEGEGPVAGRLFGAAQALHEAMGVKLDPSDQDFIDPYFARLRDMLPPEARREAEAAGRALSFEAALAEAGAWVERSGSAARA